jgi:hypothetical protein
MDAYMREQWLLHPCEADRIADAMANIVDGRIGERIRATIERVPNSVVH